MNRDDDKVMTDVCTSVTVQYMATHDPITMLVLQEFRLRAADDAVAAARIVASSPTGTEPAIPLLTSIEDGRDVATLRALHAGETTQTDAVERAGLEQLVSRWAAPKQYEPRLTERAASPPSSFRLAVTESGINVADAPKSVNAVSPDGDSTSRPIGLIWVGEPLGTDAGLLVLLGSYDAPRARDDAHSGWPLPLSHDLGVRIYENRRA